jgi:formylmethanofuran dehydrogenase subunit C
MNAVRLRLRQPVSGVRVDLRRVSPAALCGLDVEAVRRFQVARGNRRLPLGDLFDIDLEGSGLAVPTLTLEGDLGSVDRIGSQMDQGVLKVQGDVGDYAACGMTGGVLDISGRAGVFTASEMAGGRVEVGGDCGEFAAASLPGSMDGMRGGQLLIRGCAGDRLADRMRRGTVLVFGDAGDYAASRMVAGTVAIGGACGRHLAYGMRRGTVLCLGAHPDAPSTFAATRHDIRVFWSLLRRHLAAVAVADGAAEDGAAASPFTGLPAEPPCRFVGDLAADGKGELLWFDPARRETQDGHPDPSTSPI